MTLRTILPATLALAACTTSSTSTGWSVEAQRGQALAEKHCAACHAVTVNAVSPNPQAPPFADIAGKPGVTRETLRRFLQDSHNFPAPMNFRISPDAARDLAAYLATLREADHAPVQ